MEDFEQRLHHIAGKRWQIALILSVFMLVVYFGFILLVAFNREFLAGILISVTNKAGTLVPALSWGILLGALVIVFAWVLTLVYTNWANNKYDAEVSALRR